MMSGGFMLNEQGPSSTHKRPAKNNHPLSLPEFPALCAYLINKKIKNQETTALNEGSILPEQRTIV